MEDFASYYPLLFTIAGRMLHGAADVEDLVQESYLRYASTEQEISSLKSYLTTIITRLCLDYRKSARVQCEQALDLLSDDELHVEDVEEVVLQALERREQVAIALRTLLEQLSPEERSVFLLYEIFGYSYEKVATVLKKSPASCRQLMHRARTRLTRPATRFPSTQQQREQLTERFLTASQQGDEQALLTVLLQDIEQKSVSKAHKKQAIHSSNPQQERRQEPMEKSRQTTQRYLSVPEAIRVAQAGNMLLIQDDEERENEADLVLAAQFATPEKLNFIFHAACGLVCVALSGERLDALDIPLVERKNNPLQGTAFTASVDAVAGTTTGISAADRAVTIRKLVDPTARAEDFARPGHVFPLRAHPDGTLARRGHTEAAVDLMRLAGLEPGAIICEVLNSRGEAARGEELRSLAHTWGIGILTVATIARYRREHAVSFVAETLLPTSEANFRLQHYRDTRTYQDYLVLVLGELTTGNERLPLVRLHSACTTGDIFGSQRCDCQAQMHTALQRIAAEGCGMLLYLPQEGRGIGLAAKLQSYVLQEQGYNTAEANEHLGYPVDARSYTGGIAILRELGLNAVRLMTNSPRKIQALIEDGFTVERVPLEIAPTEHNQAYLHTKSQQMGHLLTLLSSQKEDHAQNIAKDHNESESLITAHTIS